MMTASYVFTVSLLDARAACCVTAVLSLARVTRQAGDASLHQRELLIVPPDARTGHFTHASDNMD
jgi:hypothetical protein